MSENLDKHLIFSNLELPHFRLQDMKIKPLIQLREMISKVLSGQTNLSKSFSILLHRDNGTYSHTYRTTQLHPVGEVWPLVRN